MQQSKKELKRSISNLIDSINSVSSECSLETLNEFKVLVQLLVTSYEHSELADGDHVLLQKVTYLCSTTSRKLKIQR